jgi:hypothetical protein
LKYCIGGSAITLSADRRQADDVFVCIALPAIPKSTPPISNVFVQRLVFVLCEEEQLSQTRVEAIRKREIDQTEQASDRHGRFGALRGQRK